MKELLYAIVKSLLLSSLCFTSTVAFTQNEKVIFNLTEGKFENAKLPYVNPIIVSGVPSKQKESVDAITLSVTRVTTDDQQELFAKRYQAEQLARQMKTDSLALALLENEVHGKISVADLETIAEKLNARNIAFLADKFEAAASLDSAGAAARIKELNNAVADEIVKVNASLSKRNEERGSLESQIQNIGKKIDEPPFFSGTWVRTSDDDDEFTFAMPDKFKMKEKYAFAFTIFKKNKQPLPIDDLLNPLVADFDETLDSVNYYTPALVSARVTTAIKTIEDNLFVDVYNIDAASKDLIPKKGFGLSTQKIKALNDLISKYYKDLRNKKISEKNARQAKVEIANILEKQKITVVQLREITSLTELPDKQSEIETKLRSINIPDLTIRTITQNYQTILRASDRAKNLEASIVTSRREIQKIFEEIKSLYMQIGKVTTSVSTGSTEIDGIPVSTTYGIGVVSLDKNTVEWFRFFGVNIRFDGFDNRLEGKEAYHSYWSRISLMVGISTTSNMQYKGNSLENTRLGVKPVIGLNWEPIKHLNLGIGMISFIQESATEVHKDPKIRPYASLSFDFNLFNYLIQNQ